MWLNLTAVILYVVNAVIRYGALDQNTTPTLPLVLSIAGVGILSFSGYLGELWSTMMAAPSAAIAGTPRRRKRQSVSQLGYPMNSCRYGGN